MIARAEPAPERSPDGGCKSYRHGTDRISAPAASLRWIGPIAKRLGVTRLADVTGLDRIGIPVFQAIRPLSLSLSVSQGKGATRAAARVSALMEAVELHHAEIAAADWFGPARAADRAFCRDVPRGFGQAAAFAAERERGWCEGLDLLGGGPLSAPHGLVSMDFTAALAPDLWPSSNGLASGNSLEEATCAALCEVIERDAQARWEAAPASHRIASAVDPAAIDDRLGRLLLRRVAAADLTVRLWDLSEAHGVATLCCVLLERTGARAMSLPPAFGAGAHPSAAVALARAITEAAQTRATMIGGARDDILQEEYDGPDAARLSVLMMAGFAPGQRAWSRVPDRDHQTIAEDIAWLLERCRVSGVRQIARIDLTRPEIGVPVVKIIVPRFGDHVRSSTL